MSVFTTNLVINRSSYDRTGYGTFNYSTDVDGQTSSTCVTLNKEELEEVFALVDRIAERRRVAAAKALMNNSFLPAIEHVPESKPLDEILADDPEYNAKDQEYADMIERHDDKLREEMNDEIPF